jgi:RNA polymerase sigma-70 factor (ECF subfamily)
MQTTSASLLMRLQLPDQPEAWTQFVRLYSPMLYTWARHMGLQQADAADLVQDVFTTLVQKLPTFSYDNHKRFRGWLWTVTRNKWREKQRRHALPLDHQQPLEALAAGEEDSLEEVEFREHLLARLVPALKDRFQPATWQAFWEHVVQDRPAAEVAARLGVSVAAVYKAKLRVLHRLHQDLADLIVD